MDRLNAYATSLDDGGVVFDAEGMALDLVTAMKAVGTTKEDFLAGISKLWDECRVEVSIPTRAKN